VALAIANSPELGQRCQGVVRHAAAHGWGMRSGLSGFHRFAGSRRHARAGESMILGFARVYQTPRSAGNDPVPGRRLSRCLQRQVVRRHGRWSAALVHGSSRAQVTGRHLQSAEYRRDLVQATSSASWGGTPTRLASLPSCRAGNRPARRGDRAMFLGSDEYFAQLGAVKGPGMSAQKPSELARRQLKSPATPVNSPGHCRVGR